MARVTVVVMPKQEILDPQGRAVANALRSLGFEEVSECRVGKVIRLTMDGAEGDLRSRAEAMASAFLANPVTEEFTVVVEGEPT